MFYISELDIHPLYILMSSPFCHVSAILDNVVSPPYCDFPEYISQKNWNFYSVFSFQQSVEFMVRLMKQYIVQINVLIG